jgi:hypothetical protein
MRYRAASLLLVSLFVASAAHASVCRLTCRTIIGGKPIDDLVTVDTDASTVNGGRAIISDDTLQWGGPTSDGQTDVRFLLNRYTGVLHATVRSRSATSTPVELYGECVPAGEKKF